MLILKSTHLYTYIWLAVWNIVTLLISLTCRVQHAKCWAAGSTSWNQDCWEKHQSRQIRRWHHPYGRKRRRTKDPLLDESERGEWKKLPSNSIFTKERSWRLVPSLHGKQMGKQWKQWQTLFSWAPKSLQVVTAAMKLKDVCFLEETLWLT